MQASYNIVLVILSYLVSVLGSYTALQLATGIPAAQGRALWFWLVGAAFSLGGGAIWAMHFIGMLAYEVPMEISYDAGLTLLSLGIAVFVVGLGLLIVGRSGGNTGMLLLGGLITGLGVASMHYMGMAAMRMPGKIQYDNMLVGVSVVIAVVAATVALWLAFNLRGNWQRIGSAIVMGIAVCGMHYTGMAAATMVHLDKPAAVVYGNAITTQVLAFGIFGVAVTFLLALLLGTIKQAKAAQEYTYKAL